jgi:DNA-directed RNA polymerase specialized sigma24 family protein
MGSGPRRPVPLVRLAVRRPRDTGGRQRRAPHKHGPVNGAHSLHAHGDENGLALEDTLEATGRPDADPVAKVLGHERLQDVLRRAGSLSDLERRALALSASDHSHRECAERLGVGERAVNNALQRARRKLAGPATAGAPD